MFRWATSRVDPRPFFGPKFARKATVHARFPVRFLPVQPDFLVVTLGRSQVIANRALEIMGHKKGEYEFCSPNDDVNKGQSTNDSYPTSAKIGAVHMHGEQGDWAFRLPTVSAAFA